MNTACVVLTRKIVSEQQFLVLFDATRTNAVYVQQYHLPPSKVSPGHTLTRSGSLKSDSSVRLLMA
jgi:hypothetical protein